MESYNDKFYNEIPSLEESAESTTSQAIQSNDIDTSLILQTLKRDIEKKDIIIKDLIKIISKLNSCNTY